MDTFSVQVGTQLRRRAIKFPARERRIRCFRHITHLACNAVLKAITNMDFAEPEAVDFEIITTLGLNNLELLRDVITRWSSTLLMIDRSLVLRPAIDHFLESNEFEEVSLYHFGDEEWKALEVFKKILDKTPTLCHALPAFEAMIKKWEQMQVEFPEAYNIIQDGIDKLTSYQARIEDVPAYTLAMCECRRT
ncbi:hypothetical protein R3P38DRAFT_3311620 [Favolaschia claudopus]|uniref:Uncharacterized protein n=1 Tax=Favolaschia claudopus TaxID=2862362 RepID=A0AAW0CG70_9AGAR